MLPHWWFRCYRCIFFLRFFWFSWLFCVCWICFFSTIGCPNKNSLFFWEKMYRTIDVGLFRFGINRNSVQKWLHDGYHLLRCTIHTDTEYLWPPGFLAVWLLRRLKCSTAAKRLTCHWNRGSSEMGEREIWQHSDFQRSKCVALPFLLTAFIASDDRAHETYKLTPFFSYYF